MAGKEENFYALRDSFGELGRGDLVSGMEEEAQANQEGSSRCEHQVEGLAGGRR